MARFRTIQRSARSSCSQWVQCWHTKSMKAMSEAQPCATAHEPASRHMECESRQMPNAPCARSGSSPQELSVLVRLLLLLTSPFLAPPFTILGPKSRRSASSSYPPTPNTGKDACTERKRNRTEDASKNHRSLPTHPSIRPNTNTSMPPLTPSHLFLLFFLMISTFLIDTSEAFRFTVWLGDKCTITGGGSSSGSGRGKVSDQEILIFPEEVDGDDHCKVRLSVTEEERVGSQKKSPSISQLPVTSCGQTIGQTIGLMNTPMNLDA